MNILVVAHYQNDGSPTAIFIHDQIKAYVAAGHTVRVIVPIPVGKRGLDGKRMGVGICNREIDGAMHSFLRYVSASNFGDKHFNTISAVTSLRCAYMKALEGFCPDVIHAHTLGTDSELGAWLKKKLRKPLVITTHGSDTSVRLSLGKTEEIKALADKGDVVVSVSSSLKNKLKQAGVATDLRVILNGFELQYVCNDIYKRKYSIIQVGNLIRQKKNDITIRALSKLAGQYPEAKLMIVGDGAERGNLEALCRELNVMDRVQFCGHLPNQKVLSQMAEAQFFCMPSVREGFGIVYLEAMASGCITIGTAGEGIADLIRDGENGFLVPPDDSKAIVKVVEWCLDHPKEAAAIAERGRSAALGLTWKKNAAEYLNLFESLIERNN